MQDVFFFEKIASHRPPILAPCLQRFGRIYSANRKKVQSQEECHWSHACKSFKRTGVGTNSIIECKFPFKPEHSALPELTTATTSPPAQKDAHSSHRLAL
jgi:hypothetical protein